MKDYKWEETQWESFINPTTDCELAVLVTKDSGTGGWGRVPATKEIEYSYEIRLNNFETTIYSSETFKDLEAAKTAAIFRMERLNKILMEPDVC